MYVVRLCLLNTEGKGSYMKPQQYGYMNNIGIVIMPADVQVCVKQALVLVPKVIFDQYMFFAFITQCLDKSS